MALKRGNRRVRRQLNRPRNRPWLALAAWCVALLRSTRSLGLPIGLRIGLLLLLRGLFLLRAELLVLRIGLSLQLHTSLIGRGIGNRAGNSAIFLCADNARTNYAGEGDRH